MFVSSLVLTKISDFFRSQVQSRIRGSLQKPKTQEIRKASLERHEVLEAGQSVSHRPQSITSNMNALMAG